MCVCDAAKSLSNVLNGLIFEQTSRSQRQSDLSAQTTFSAGTRKNSVAAIHSNFPFAPCSLSPIFHKPTPVDIGAE